MVFNSRKYTRKYTHTHTHTHTHTQTHTPTAHHSPKHEDKLHADTASHKRLQVFTAPVPDDVGLLDADPLAVRGLHFDLVVNGVELGGGSIRNHDAVVQQHIITHILHEDLSAFEHMVEALSLGAPPHGGIALGFDRLVMVLLGAKSLRDVIAFPKSFAGRDLMGGV